MAFRIPTFNLTANVWRGLSFVGPLPPPDLVVQANLQFAHKSKVDIADNPGLTSLMYLLVPAGTDIRGRWQPTFQADAVEIPAGSRRFYAVIFVDDVAKGFGNEYRIAGMVQIDDLTALGLTFPIPLP